MSGHLGGIGPVEWEDDEGSDWCRLDVETPSGSCQKVGVTLSHVQHIRLMNCNRYCGTCKWYA